MKRTTRPAKRLSFSELSGALYALQEIQSTTGPEKKRRSRFNAAISENSRAERSGRSVDTFALPESVIIIDEDETHFEELVLIGLDEGLSIRDLEGLRALEE